MLLALASPAMAMLASPLVSRAPPRSAGFTTADLPPSVFRDLEAHGYAVVEQWLSAEDVSAVLEDAISLKACETVHSAGVGGALDNDASGWAVDDEVRRSKTVWIQRPLGTSAAASSTVGGSGGSDTQRTLVRAMEELRARLASACSLRLDGRSTMMSYLYYPRGGFFRRHRDGPRSVWASDFREFREISFLLYLDAGWREQDGGALRIYTARDPGTYQYDQDIVGTAAEPSRDVLPAAGTLVLLRSPQIEHEVLETRRRRHCVVGWFCAAVEAGRVLPARSLWQEEEDSTADGESDQS